MDAIPNVKMDLEVRVVGYGMTVTSHLDMPNRRCIVHVVQLFNSITSKYGGGDAYY